VWTVDIDVGGTLTDGIFTQGNQIHCVKVDSTPHDLTVCLFDCLAQGAAKLGFVDAATLLEDVELIRWSTTITSNVLAERHGPRIGLLVTRGNEVTLYGAGARSTVLGRLLTDRDVSGIDENAADAEIMTAAHALLESGVRRVCISLRGSQRDPQRELRMKRVIDQQYPDHFLGSVPVLAGSDISKSADDETRTYCAVINAYTHGALAATLFKAEDELRDTARYAGSFLVSHTSGGVAGIAKTRAIDTIESGPVLGIQGSAFLAREYGLRDVIAMDIGGTTAKLSVLRNGEAILRKPSDFFGIPVQVSLPYLRSIALGGGSVVRASAGSETGIALGPESMGAYPGPACYALGGDQATITDAFVAAGLINPGYFLGGTKRIDADVARQAVADAVAAPLKISLDEACRRIVDQAFTQVAAMVRNAQQELALDLSRDALFAFGGNGGLFACGVAEKAGLGKVRIFSLGPVFSAFGSSVSDICHVYERALSGAVTDESAALIRNLLTEIRAEAAKDLLGEGIRPDQLTYTIEFELAGSATLAACPESSLHDAASLRAALAASQPNAAASGGLRLAMMRVQVKKPMPKPRLERRAAASADSAHARTGSRPVLWGSKQGAAQIYRWESLQPGNRVEGCAILEGEATTYFVPEGWTLEIDGLGNAAIERGTRQGS
jgi:N-methylhydantoinase A/oxoprolinase/acetone carboxylase beta subunit